MAIGTTDSIEVKDGGIGQAPETPSTQPIRGYRDLSPTEIALINEVKDLGPELERIVTTIMATEGVDKRWASIGKTHLQEGLMALVRSIAQPTGF